MDKTAELASLAQHIPAHSEYPESKLIIAIPSTSKIEEADLESIFQEARQKGWKDEEIVKREKSGYSRCKACGKTIHLHIKSPDYDKCIYCGSKDIDHTSADISVQ